MKKQHAWGVAVLLVVCAIAVSIVLRWSTPEVTLIGDWVEPIPGMEDQVQGFSLREDGIAESIEMATLQYRHWRVEGEALVLSGESIGNGMTSDFEETYRVEFVDAQRLDLVDARGESRLFTRR